MLIVVLMWFDCVWNCGLVRLLSVMCYLFNGVFGLRVFCCVFCCVVCVMCLAVAHDFGGTGDYYYIWFPRK